MSFQEKQNSSNPTLFTDVWSSIEKTGNNDTAGTGIANWNLLKFTLKGSETSKLTLPSRFGRNSTVGKLISKYLEIDF